MLDKPKPKLKLKPKHESINHQKISSPLEANSVSSVLPSSAEDIPLMFQAQIQNRGNIQYVGDRDKNDQPKYEKWVKEWLQGCPPKPEKEDESIPSWKRKPVQSLVKFPRFGPNVRVLTYQIRWRILTNGGQDGDLIRPVIGSKGIPFFPGSSMKGAFRNACPEEKRQRYCGGEVVDEKGNKQTKPGILRFHGGYPEDMTWAKANRLVDIAHGQQPYQVMKSKKDKGENANVQISLYQPKFSFGISCPEISPDSREWDEIKQIWEEALGNGIGSRVSAGYGYVQEVEPNNEHILFSVHLNGQGITSQLLLKDPQSRDKFKTREFRPNMFKATLRGHTLRLLGGLTDEQTTKSLTQFIWGGIPEKGEKGKAIVGRVGISFSIEGTLNDKDKHYYTNEEGKAVEMPIYTLNDGYLSLIKQDEVNSELEIFLQSLIQFSVLFGGFGKSWRRIHHKLFYPDYFRDNDNPMIGCHWDLTSKSQDFLVFPLSDLSGITNFINGIRTQAIAWIQTINGSYTNSCAKNWREAWHPDKVQVWGRLAKNQSNSKAIYWFHGNYQAGNTIKESTLTGKMGKIGRIWHRMYPHFKILDNKASLTNNYVEILTIFPDDSEQTEQFLEFLETSSDFQLLWPLPPN